MAPTENCWVPLEVRVGLSPNELTKFVKGMAVPRPPAPPINSRAAARSAGKPKLNVALLRPPDMENCAALELLLKVIKPTVPVWLRTPAGETEMVPPLLATKLPKLKPRVAVKLCAKSLCSAVTPTKIMAIKNLLNHMKPRNEMAWVN